MNMLSAARAVRKLDDGIHDLKRDCTTRYWNEPAHARARRGQARG